MAEGTCTADECAGARYARGYCRTHYVRAVRSGELATKPRRGGACSLDDCDEPHYGKGLCKKHYRQDYHRGHRERAAEVRAAWTAANGERARDARRAHYLRNRARLNRKSEDWRRRNRERLLAYARNYNRQHPERFATYRKRNAEKCALRARENARRRRRGPDGLPIDFAAILADHGMTCHICGGAIADMTDLHFDHVIPLARGGTHTAGNLRPAHAFCNRSKGARIA